MYVTKFLVETDTEKKDPNVIDEYMVNEWVNDDSKNKRGTRRVKLACVKSYLKYCHAKGHIKTNPAELVQVNMRLLSHAQKEVKEKQVFTGEEVSWLCRVSNNMWSSFIVIGVETGLRMGDILQLEWDCWDGECLTVWTDKRDKRVELKASPMLRLLMQERWRRRDGSDYLFPEDRNNYLKNGSQYYSTAFKRICVDVGLEDRCFHGLRATYATNQNRDGKTSEAIAADLGHSNKKLTEEVYIK